MNIIKLKSQIYKIITPSLSSINGVYPRTTIPKNFYKKNNKKELLYIKFLI